MVLKKIVVLKFLLVLFLVHVLMIPAFAQIEPQINPTEKGTLDVSLKTEPADPKPGDSARLVIDFINPNNNRIQEHIDYRVTVLKEESTIFGPIPLTHTSSGSVKIPVEFTEEGFYAILIEVEGILFQPIPPETVSFMLRIGEASAQSTDDDIPVNGDEGGGCLIATAAFGSELSPQIQNLREIRDNVVLKTKSGAGFMTNFNQLYYSISPFIADYERENQFFKDTVRLVITPMLTTLNILNYVEINSEEEMMGYGIGIIMLNVGMYFFVPAFAILKLYQFRRN